MAKASKDPGKVIRTAPMQRDGVENWEVRQGHLTLGSGPEVEWPTAEDFEPFTVQELADLLGVSHQRVTQIEQEAMGKLRKRLRGRIGNPFR